MEPRTAAQRQEDLDAFLTIIESKLRGPFSSLDLSKAITTTALRGSLSPNEYLQMISQVLSRTDKIIQLRVLIALLGLDPSTSSSSDEDMDNVIYQLLTQAQEAPAYEEWVRTVAGLVRGIMFTEVNENNHVDDENDSPCRGEDAQSVLDKTCQDIFKSVLGLEQSTRRKVEEERASSLWVADREPLFAPYRYSLINPDLLDEVIPECSGTGHQYFQVNRDAAILSKDMEIEKQKAQEESKTLMARAASTSSSTTTSSAEAATKVAGNDTVTFPGFKSNAGNGGASATKPKVPLTKSSMFLPTKRPGMGVAVARAMPTKTAIHARKAGAAQALVAKSRRPGLMSAGGVSTATKTSTATASVVGGSMSSTLVGRSRATNQNQNRSKMKMIDVKEVEGLNKEHHERGKIETKEQKQTARKRKIMEAAAEKGLVIVGKKAKANGEKVEAASSTMSQPQEEVAPTPQPKQQASQPSPATTSIGATSAAAAAAGGALAQAVLLAYQQKISDGQVNAAAVTQVAKEPASLVKEVSTSKQPTNNSGITAAANSGIPAELRALLDKANKLAPEDRLRVEQFFNQRFNPTPDVLVYRMKLHENRATDPETGQAVKETFYLELDYNTFETKQLRKVKRK